MNQILSTLTAGVSELKRNPSALLEKAGNSIVAILNHNKPAAYLVPPETYEYLLNLLEDQDLGKMVKKRQKYLNKAVSVSLDDL